jgi:hypothetical protein
MDTENGSMTEISGPMDILKLLDKSNCRKCNKPTCLAFAAAVFKGEKELEECPNLDSEIIEKFGGKDSGHVTLEKYADDSIEALKKKITAIDLSARAQRIGAKFANGKLTIRVLGKDFSVDAKGSIITDIHVHSWITIPVLNYIIDSAGVPISGEWVPFRELAGGKTWYRLFGQRCEKPLKRVADTYTNLFEDMILIFNGKQVENHYASDISLVLHPLPKVPILICYWKPDDGLESDLNLFFDATAEENLNIESLFTLGTGLAIMFEKLGLRHGHNDD